MFVGRLAELALLRAELRVAAAGPARTVVIDGPEGIGKTALVRHVLGEVPDVRVLAASGEQSERRLRYGVVRQLVDEVPGHDAWTVGQAICDLVERAQAGGPVVVLVDDAQWADRASLRALGYALRRMRGGRVLVLIACRDAGDAWLPEGLRRLMAADGTRRITLTGLPAAELARLPGRGTGDAGPVLPRGRPADVTCRPAPDGQPPEDVAAPRSSATRPRLEAVTRLTELRVDAGAGPPAVGRGRGSGPVAPGRDGGGPPVKAGAVARAGSRGKVARAGEPSRGEIARAGEPSRGEAARAGEPSRVGGGAGEAASDGRADSPGPGQDGPAGVPELPREGAAFSTQPLTGRAAARLREHTQGNPLHASALLAAFPVSLLADPAVRLPAPGTYTRSFARRLRACGAPARALVAACAVLGGPCTLQEAATVARAGAGAGGLDGWLDALEEAVAAGLLVELPGRVIGFPEPLARAAAYDGLGAGTRARLHLAAVRVTGDAGTALRHRAAAAGGPDEALAGELARYAVKEAQHGLWQEAAAHLELAAGLSESAVRRDELRTAVLEHVLIGGDAVRAAELAAIPNGDPRPVRRYVLGRLALACGRLEEAGRLLTEAWPRREPGFAADVAEQLAWSHLLRDERAEAARWARVAIEQPIQGAAGRPYDVLALSGRSCDGAPGDSLATAVELLRADEVGRARAVLERVAAAAGGAGLPCHRLLADGLLAAAEYRDGRWEDALARAERAAAEAAELGQHWLVPCLEVVCVAPLAARGEDERALAHVRTARTVARRQHNVLGEAQADLALGLLGAGLPGAGDVFVPDTRPQLVETFVAAGALSEAEAVLAEMDADTVTSGVAGGTRVRAQRARLAGVLLAGRNVPAEAERKFTEALTLLAGGVCPLEEARVLLDLGRLLRRTGRRRAAAERLRAARAIFAWLGARPLVTRCARELEACGLEPAATARLGLTPQEFSTARLVADGLTNRQIARELLISVKTVEYHMGKIYTKLGIGSRVALAAKLAAHAGRT